MKDKQKGVVSPRLSSFQPGIKALWEPAEGCDEAAGGGVTNPGRGVHKNVPKVHYNAPSGAKKCSLGQRPRKG